MDCLPKIIRIERDKVLKQLSEHLDNHELKNIGDGDIMIYDLRNWIKRQAGEQEANHD